MEFKSLIKEFELSPVGTATGDVYGDKKVINSDYEKSKILFSITCTQRICIFLKYSSIIPDLSICYNNNIVTSC